MKKKIRVGALVRRRQNLQAIIDTSAGERSTPTSSSSARITRSLRSGAGQAA